MKFLIASLVLALASPCGDGTVTPPETGVDDDAGPMLLGDAGPGDAAPAADAGAMESPVPAPLATEFDDAASDFDVFGAESRAGSEPGDADTSTCYDGIDEGSEGTDCDDPGCQRLVSCCVGTTNCCVRGPERVRVERAALDACTDVAGCAPLAGLTPFGDPAPFVHTEGGLSLGGDETFASGLVGDAVDLRVERATLTFEVSLPACDTCLESASVGFLGARPSDDAPLQVLAGATAAQGHVALILQDRVVGRIATGAGAAFTLAVLPTGTVELRGEGEIVSVPFTPRGLGHFALWGHSENPDGDGVPGARIRSLTARTDLCEMPEAWGERRALRFQEGSNPTAVPLPASADPSVVVETSGDAMLAFFDGAGLRFARRSSQREYTLFAPSLSEPLPTDLIEPELVPIDGQIFLYARKGARIVRAPIAPGGGEIGLGAATEELLFDGEVPYDVSVAPIDGDHTYRYAMVGIDEVGAPRAYASEDGRTFFAWSQVPTAGLGASRVSAPALVVLRGAYHLYLTVHRGTRAHLAHYTSAELLHWRLVDDDVLGPRGNGAERLAVSAPAVLPTAEGIDLIYVGDDGAETHLHVTSRVVPAGF